MTRRGALVVVGVVGAALLALGVVATAWTAAAWSRVDRVEVTPTSSDADSTTYALVGLDSREAALDDGDRGATVFPDADAVTGARADVVLLVRSGPAGVRALAVPRDLLVTDATGRPGRLALTWQREPQALLEGLCSIGPGIGVDHVVAVDYRAVVSAVDAVGGLPITTTASVRDRKAHLRPTAVGAQTLDGEQALAWVRSRRPEVRGPAGWQPTEPAAQRAVVAADLLSAVEDRAWSRWPWLLGSLPQIADGVQVDPSFGIGDARRLADALGAVDGVTELPATLVDGELPVARHTTETAPVAQTFADGDTCRIARPRS